MEEQIKHVASRLKVIFISFWLLPVIRPSATAQDMASFAQEDTFAPSL